jgi:hypothetical protein
MYELNKRLKQEEKEEREEAVAAPSA